MNTSLKSIENEVNNKNDKKQETPKQKPKQLTLFDMKSKGKFSMSAENDSENNTSPALNRSLNGKQKSNKNTPKKEDEEEEELILVDDESPSENKVEPTDSKNTPKTSEKKKSAKKPNDNKKNSNIMEYFSKNDQDNENLNKSLSGLSLKVENEKTPIREKSTRVRSKTSTENVPLPKRSPRRNITLKDKIQECSKLAFQSEGQLTTLENYMFGDVAAVIELYNSVVNVYNENQKQKQKKTKSKTKNEDTQLNDDIEVVKIDYNEFLNIFTSYAQTGKEYYSKIIRSFLTIFIKHEKIFGDCKPFGIDFTNLDYQGCFLQELTRYILNILLPEINYEESNSELNIMYTEDLIREHFPIMNELEINYSEEPFGDLSTYSKIQLLQTLCDQLLLGEKFEKIKGELELGIEKSKANIQDRESKLAKALKVADKDFTKSREKYMKEARDKNSFSLNKLINAIDRFKIKIERDKVSLNNLTRIEPLGVDSNGNCYWQFSFFQGIVIECKTNMEEKSEWYLVEDLKKCENLINHLKKALKDGQLVTKLKVVYDKWFEETEKARLENEQAQKDSDVQMCDDEVDQVPKKRVTRNQAKRASEALLDLTTGSFESDTEIIESSEDEEIKKKKKNKKRDRKSRRIYDDYDMFDWIEFTDDSYQIDKLWMYMINMERLLLYRNLLNLENSNETLAMLNNYCDINDFMGKFEILKNVLHHIPENMNFMANRYLLLKNTKPMSNGLRPVENFSNYIENCQSLSALYLSLFLILKNIRWEYFDESKKCTLCKDSPLESEFKLITGIKELENDDSSLMGYFVCIRCNIPYHKKCVLESSDKKKQNYVCKDCTSKKQFFEYQAETDENVEDNKINLSEEYCDSAMKLRTRKAKETSRKSDQSDESIGNKRNSISRSNSNSSVSSLANKYNYETNNKYKLRQTKKKNYDEKNADNFGEDAVPKRSSSRFQGSKPKKYCESSDDEE